MLLEIVFWGLRVGLDENPITKHDYRRQGFVSSWDIWAWIFIF